MIGAIIGGIVFGRLSDRFGRRNAMILAFLGAIAAIPLWALPSTVAWLALGAFPLQFMVQGAWGVIPAHISELSPDASAAPCPASPTNAAISWPALS